MNPPSGKASAGYTRRAFTDADDVLGDYPGEMRFLTGPLQSDQVAVTYRRMPAGTGGKGGYGHRHRTQEEVYMVTSGLLVFKLGDDIVEVPAGHAIRVAPEVARSVWNDGPLDAEVLIVSTTIEDLRADIETVPDFWPE
jgi:mannose-6-phosphate isomerase-like protein (cupin superfamily)